MQMSGTYPQLSDNTKKTVKTVLKPRSELELMRGSAISGKGRLNLRSIHANRGVARERAGRKD